MDLGAILKTINWKTSGCAVAFLLCNIVGGLYPPVADVCGILDKIFVAMGILSAADSGRVQNIVQAVDHIYTSVKIDPATLPPPNMPPVSTASATVQSWLPLVLLVPFAMFVTGCASYIDRGDGRYERVVSAQEPVWFGVSNSFPELQNCKGTQKEGYNYENLDFTECHTVRKGVNTSAPGLIHTVIAVAGNVLSFGLLGLLAGGGGDTTTNSMSQSQSQGQIQGQAVIIPGKGH